MRQSPEAQDIALLLQTIHRTMHARLCHKVPIKEVGELTIQQIRALQFIQQHPQIPMGDIAKELSITKASVNALVGRLYRKGWLARAQDRQDHRVYRISLTAFAKKRFQETLRQKQRVSEELIQTLSHEDRRHLHRILLQLSTQQ